MKLRAAITALAVSALLVSSAGSATSAKPNPEVDDRGPGQDEGYFAGFPSPTYSWHGCTKFSAQSTPETLDDGVPATAKANAQSKVTWTVTGTASDYVVSWKVADGWKICGAQAAVLGSDPTKDFDLAVQTGYTSKASKGSTSTTGSETIRVKLSKKDAQSAGIDATYAGTYAISKIYSLYVFVKKAKKK